LTAPQVGRDIAADHSRQRVRGGTTLVTAPTGEKATMLGFIITLIIVGGIAGLLARFLVPGRDPLGILGTIVLGVVGSFVGGFLGYLLFGADSTEGAVQPSGIVGSIIGAVIALLAYRAVNRSGSRV
jgi:uncharacterized membrane protein YeaQ/YmgE (transglycosylase-associated protein family)